MLTSGLISLSSSPSVAVGWAMVLVWCKPKTVLASRYSGRMSRDGVLFNKGRMFASELWGDLRATGELEVDKERESRGGLCRNSSKLLLKMAGVDYGA